MEGFYYNHIDVFTHATEIPHHLIIGDSNHSKTSCFNPLCTNFILQQAFLFVVLRTIQLYNQSYIMAIEIHDIVINDLLP